MSETTRLPLFDFLPERIKDPLRQMAETVGTDTETAAQAWLAWQELARLGPEERRAALTLVIGMGEIAALADGSQSTFVWRKPS